MTIAKSLGFVIGLVLVSAGPALADTQTILGQRMRVEDPLPGVNASKRWIVVVARERYSPNTIVGDPIANGAKLQVIVKGGTTSEQTFTLPAGPPSISTGSGWTGSNTPGVAGTYTYIDKNGEASPVTKLRLSYRAGSTFTIQAVVDAQGNNGPVNVVPGNPTSALGITITIGGGDTYCVLFGGTAGGRFTEDSRKAVRVVRPTAGGCPIIPPLCSDGVRNAPTEECDAPDDADCPGQCGDPLGLFPCLCENLKRVRVVEHANTDLDNGYTGRSHDSGIVEGGGYVTDLWDCDGPLGPDTLCHVGPHCSDGARSPCGPVLFGNTKRPLSNLDSGNEICAALGEGSCRRTIGGTMGPHCEIAIDQWCANDGDCPGDERCLKTYHSAPLPLASGGISVCVVNTFTEDIVGTKDLVSGAAAVRLRQDAATYLGPDQQQPCPVCGGFCSGNGGPFSPGVRNLCTTDADCTAPATCVTDFVCSWGPNKDQACNPNTPVGGATEFFGNPSSDCPMAGSLLGAIDILFNPTTTSNVSLTANIDCGTSGFNNKVCAGGLNQHAVCTVDSECPGGTCNEQCFCPGSGQNQKPNGCEAACVGGANDAQPCTDNSECNAPQACVGGARNGLPCLLETDCLTSCVGGPNTGAVCTVASQCPSGACTPTFGECLPHQCLGGPNNGAACSLPSECPSGLCGSSPCHPADCRLNQDRCEGGPNEGALCTLDSECPGGTCGDFDSCQEGRCTVGPDDRTCSRHTFVSCTSDAGCRPSGTCSFCDESETCDSHRRECFVNPTIQRCGSPGVPDHIDAAVFCEAKTASAAVNATAGLPGPGAETAHVTDTVVGCP